MPEGRLFYVVGASGSGKDSLLAYARGRLAGEPGVAFAHRYITRPADAGGENHVALAEAEFQARRQAGLFAMDWRSHGLRYGVGREINLWLAKGVHVVVNGSREYLLTARAFYPSLVAVLIDVSPQVLAERLRARGREDDAAIDARLARHARLRETFEDCIAIPNDSPLQEGGEILARLIRQHNASTACA
jgi:ribose 1,5-bisphosphokinase